jgi:hypothetical protein
MKSLKLKKSLDGISNKIEKTEKRGSGLDDKTMDTMEYGGHACNPSMQEAEARGS